MCSERHGTNATLSPSIMIGAGHFCCEGAAFSTGNCGDDEVGDLFLKTWLRAAAAAEGDRPQRRTGAYPGEEQIATGAAAVGRWTSRRQMLAAGRYQDRNMRKREERRGAAGEMEGRA